MRGIVSQADAINKRVREKISPRLYLFCNFDEGSCWWLSEDSRYLHHVLNLYKVMIETNYITGRAKMILTGEDYVRWKEVRPMIRYDELEQLTGLINCFRSVEAHNISESNGYFQKQETAEYNQWVFSVIHTDLPSCEEHFVALNQKLEEISLRFEGCVDAFLSYVEQAPDKDEIVKRWENALIGKYTQNDNYLYGQMADMYFSLYPARYGCNVPKNMNKNQMRSVIGKWIMNYYQEPFEKIKQMVEEDYRRKESMVKSVEARRAIREQAEKDLDNLEEQKKQSLMRICKWNHLKNMDELRLQHYSRYFRESTMPTLIEELLKEYPESSLLPQDILQLLVYTYMRETCF